MSAQMWARAFVFAMVFFLILLVLHPAGAAGTCGIIGTVLSLFFLGYFIGFDRATVRLFGRPAMLEKPYLTSYQEWERDYSYKPMTKSSNSARSPLPLASSAITAWMGRSRRNKE